MSIKTKKYLENLYRSKPNAFSRKEYIRLDMNEGIPGLPENFIKSVISKACGNQISMYPEYSKLEGEIASYHNLRPGNILLSNGSDAAIKYIFDAYISAKDKVLLTDPTFAMYPVYCKMFGAKAISVSYNKDLSFPEEEFLSKISKDIKLAIIVNPNNPTGSVLKKEAILRILEKCLKNDVILIIDEAYFYPESFINMINRFKNLIILRTFSKLCGMASLRIGYAASCPEIIENLRKVKPTYDVNGIAVLFAGELLRSPKIINNLIKSADKGKKYLIDRLDEKGFSFIEGNANFVLIKCKGKVNRIIGKLFKKKILVGGNFKQDFLRDYIRVTTADKNIMEEFWKHFISEWEE